MRTLALVLLLLTPIGWAAGEDPCPRVERAEARAAEEQSRINREIYIAVLQISQLERNSVDEYLTRRQIDPQTVRRHEASHADTEARVKKIGAPAATALVGIVTDASEGPTVRRNALKLLLSLPEARIHFPALVAETKSLLQEVFHEIHLSASDPLTFPAAELPAPKTNSPTLKKMLGSGYSNEQIALSALVAGLSESGRDNPEVRKFLDNTLFEILFAARSEGTNDSGYLDGLKRDLINPLVTRRRPDELGDFARLLEDHVPYPANLEALKLVEMQVERLRLDSAGRPKPTYAKPFAKVTKSILSRFEREAEPEINHMNSDYGTLVGFLAQMGELPANDRRHPNRYFPDLIKRAAGRALTESERFILRNYATTLYNAKFAAEEMRDAHPAMLQLIDRLRDRAATLPEWDAQKEMKKASEYTDLFFLIEGVPWSHYTVAERRKALTPLLDPKFGPSTNAAAQKILSVQE